jgi:tRNA 2-selenouridine synthase
MPVRALTAAEAIERLGEFDAILDARSPAEFALDRLPGAANWWVLDDEERREVGTDYKQVAPFEARKRGAALVARNIARHIEAHTSALPRTWTPLVYCWRGGQRSGALAWFLDQIGFRTHVVQGGYKAFRHEVLKALDSLPTEFRYRVICGKTGSGKTRLLAALRARGAQVLDLEALASHRGSVLGLLPDAPQPSQKAFETSIWQALRGFDPALPVFVESESRKVGNLRVPEALMTAMRASPDAIRVELPDHERVRLLLEDYGFFADQTELFERQLEALVPLRGRETVSAWQTEARAGRWAEVFADLMVRHYDPGYLKSMQQNFAGFAAARELRLARVDDESFIAAAGELWPGAGQARDPNTIVSVGVQSIDG